MRKLFILRGCQGSGKSQIIKELGVEDNTLSFSAFRNLFYDTRSTLDDNQYCYTGETQMYDKKIVEAMLNAAESRMVIGSTLFIDSMNLNNKDLAKWKNLARKYYYDMFIIDVQGEKTDKELIHMNKKKGLNTVDERSLLDHARKGREKNFLSDYKVISIEDIKQELSISNLTVDAEKYKKVIVVGDVHGHYDELIELLAPHGGINNKNNLYVFSGDLIDRGEKSIEVVEHILGKKRDNVIVVEGNHEMNMRHVLSGTKPRVSYQTKKTRDEMLEKGWKEKDIKRILLDNLVPFVLLKNVVGSVKPVLVTHAGVTAQNFSHTAMLKPITEYTYGSSNRNKVSKGHSTYSSYVDILLDKYSDSSYIQVHGHRNKVNNNGIIEYPFRTGNIYNVEAGITEQGSIRSAVFSDIGIMSHEVSAIQ